MLVVKVQGGLGNQLFQYAFGKQLSLRSNCRLILDISEYDLKDNKRNFLLQEFRINCELISTKRIIKNKYLNYLINKIIYNFKFYRENKVSVFNEKVSLLNDGYFDGYWQSEKYFNDIRNLLIEELTPKLINRSLLNIVKQIDKNSVSVHIRKSDYLTKDNSCIYAEITTDYYYNAMNYFLSINNNSKFFIFSDDFQWVKDNLVFTKYNFEFITGNTIEDIYLMSKCQNHIIANSSFSWWGAWLNNKFNKIVIAPKYWFTKKSNIQDEIVPLNWLKFHN